jgi:hypothetical protein
MATVNVVEVRWDDASIETDDFSRKNARKTKPVDRWTTGYLIEETDDCLVLATDYYVKKKGEEFAGKLIIPWGVITEYWVFR